MLNPSRNLARNFKRLYECKGSAFANTELKEFIAKGEIKPEEFSIRALAEEFVPDGREWVSMLDPRHVGGYVEAASFAVDTAAFSNITGQIVYSTILQAYDQVPNIISGMIPTMPTRFSGEKIAGMGQIGDAAEIVGEGEDYPTYGVSEDWIETPQTYKRGFIVPVTREAIFFDRTNLIIQRASDVGSWMRTNREKRAIDCVIDSALGVVNKVAGDHRYNWQGTSYASFQSSTPWINIKTSNGLVDWTDIDAAEQLWANMTDPFTGEPINVGGRTLLCCPELQMTARSILTATAWQVGDTTGTAPVRIGPNLVEGYSLVASPQLKARLSYDSQATTHWYLADMARAFMYSENWPLTVVQAPPNSDDDFKRDIVAQYKASERGSFFTKDPRYIIKNTVA